MADHATLEAIPKQTLPGDPFAPAGSAKVLIYIALTVVAAAVAPLSDNKLDLLEGINLVIAFLGAILVWYATANKAVKTIVAFILAGLQALVLLLGPGIGLGDIGASAWLGVILAAAAGIGLFLVPNKPAPGLIDSETYLYGDNALVTQSGESAEVTVMGEHGPPVKGTAVEYDAGL